ncbi:MAG: alpha/beta hydrolase [Synergistales bacterium]|nr:alpha/beta hydrolase [Synergistales bacterium]
MSITRLALWVAVIYGVFCGGIYLLQDKMIYQPWGEITATPSRVGLFFENVSFEASDGVPLHGWFIPAEKGYGKVLLFFHGNAGNISHRLESIRTFHDMGLDVLIFDYRGYGKSGGKPSEEGLYRDGTAAMEFLLERGYFPDEIIMFGRSLGGAVAARVSMETTPLALILESSFTSLVDMASMVARFFPVRQLLRSEYPTESILPYMSCPVLVVHSPDDEVIPFSQGLKLYEAAPEPKAFLEIKGDHNGGFILSGETYRQGLKSFLSDIACIGR